MEKVDIDIESIRNWQKNPVTVFFKRELLGAIEALNEKLKNPSLEKICSDGFSESTAHSKGLRDALILSVKNIDEMKELIEYYNPKEEATDEKDSSSRA